MSGADSYVPGVSPNPSNLDSLPAAAARAARFYPTPPLSTSAASNGTAGSLPDSLGRLAFSPPTSHANLSLSPIPHRGIPPGMIGGGMFGPVAGMSVAMPNSSLRSGAVEEVDEVDVEDPKADVRSKGSSEDRGREGEDWVAGVMEL